MLGACRRGWREGPHKGPEDEQPETGEGGFGGREDRKSVFAYEGVLV